MSSDNEDVVYEGDADLDNVEPPPARLPPFETGDYDLTLKNVVRVDGRSGVYDIFEWAVDSAKGEGANAKGTMAKISFKRDNRGRDKQIADKRLASCLIALNGGQMAESNAAFIKNLRKNPSGKIRAKIDSAVAEGSGRTYKTYLFYALS